MRVALAVALVLVAGGLILDMSGSAPRTAGSDHVSSVVFAATVPAGGQLCQVASALPGDAASAQLLIGSYGHPLPALSMSFLDAGGHTTATGYLAAGGREGTVTIPLRQARGGPPSRRVCLTVGRGTKVALGGEGIPINPGAEYVNGVQQAGRVSLLYFRRGSESWWQLLPELSTRFGVGKAGFFGVWLLPFSALLLAGVWVATVRLLVRESR